MPAVQGRPGGLLQFMRLVGKYTPVLLWAHFKSSLEVSEHALNARSRDCERLDLYVGITLFTCCRMEAVGRFILTSPELCIFA